MKRLEIDKLIRDHPAEKEALASILFPRNAHPMQAFKRVLSGEALLNSAQLKTLAEYLDIDMNQLWDITWTKAELIKAQRSEFLMLRSGSYKVILNKLTWTTKIFHGDDLKVEEILHNGALSLSDYLNLIKKKIDGIKNQTRSEQS